MLFLQGKFIAGEAAMAPDTLGKTYTDGQIIVEQGSVGDCMYVIQEGEVEVLVEKQGRQVTLATLGEKELFGEMAIFEKELRSATVRAIGDVRVITVDKKSFLRRIHEDPSLALRIVETMSRRIRELDGELALAQTEGRRGHHRIQVSTTVMLQKQGMALEACLCDVSPSGARVELTDNLQVGQKVVLRISNMKADIAAAVIRKDPANRYGLQFVMPLKEHIDLAKIGGS
jgi:CRP-like cAMP-binding protein